MASAKVYQVYDKSVKDITKELNVLYVENSHGKYMFFIHYGTNELNRLHNTMIGIPSTDTVDNVIEMARYHLNMNNPVCVELKSHIVELMGPALELVSKQTKEIGRLSMHLLSSAARILIYKRPETGNFHDMNDMYRYLKYEYKRI